MRARSRPRLRRSCRSSACSSMRSRPTCGRRWGRSRSAALAPFVSIVGLFVDAVPADVRATLAAVPLDLLQFHGHETPEFCRDFGRPYLKALPVAPGVEEAGLVECAERYNDAGGLLFDAPPTSGQPGGTGRTFDWSTLPAGRARPIVLSFGLSAGDVGDAIRRVRPWAVDVSSGVEAVDAAGMPIKGIKDPARIAAFIEEVRHADD